MEKINIHLSIGKPEFKRPDINLRVPNDGYQYVQFKPDWEVLENKLPRQYQSPPVEKYGFPAIVNRNFGLLTQYNNQVYDYVPLPEAWQWFLWELWDWSTGYQLPRGEIEYYYTKTNNSGQFAYATPGSLTWYYVNMIEKSRAFTDSWSPEVGGCDFVTGRNLGAKPYEWLFRPTILNLVRIKSDAGKHWELEALDVTKPPPSIEWLVGQPHLINWANEIRPEKLPDGRFPVSNFPQAEACSRIHGLPFFGTPIPLLSLGGSIKIVKSSVRMLSGGQSYSPYVPEK